MTMTFRGDRVGTVFNALTNRGDPTSGLTAPIPQACRSRSLGRGDRPCNPVDWSVSPTSHHLAHRPAVAGMRWAGIGTAPGHRGQQVDPAPPRPSRSCYRCTAGGNPGAGCRRSNPVSTAGPQWVTEPRTTRSWPEPRFARRRPSGGDCTLSSGRCRRLPSSDTFAAGSQGRTAPQ